MESERQSTERETPPQHWRSCKLIIDPALTKGLYKVYRYDGQQFNIPVEDLGLFPVEAVRDPRICRLWSKCNKTDLLISKFKVDEWYVGPVPPKEVTFSRLNDNVREAFLTHMCSKYGNLEEVEIFYNPKNKKHLGIAKAVFDTVRAAKDAVQYLHQTSVMGNVIHVEIDPKGENRARYLQLLLRGLYTPWTLPVGGSERAIQSSVDTLLRQGSFSSPTSIATPLSLDTAYSSIWQDTPCSFGLTPRSQGTPRTPCLSATPLSQDSCYSSLQATPVLQGEPSTYSVHKPLRQELCHRRPARYHRGSSEVSDVTLILKHCQPQPPHPLPAQIQSGSPRFALWGRSAQSSSPSNTEPSYNLASPCQESRDMVTDTSKTLQRNCNSFSILSINFTADRQAAASPPPDDHPCITELSPSAGNCSSSSPQPEVESLDSRIENLLTNSQITDPSYFDRKTLAADEHSQDSPTSPCSTHTSTFSNDSLVCTKTYDFTTSRQCSYSDLVTINSASLVETEEDETTQAVLFLTRNAQSPSDFTQFENRAHVHNEKEAESVRSFSCLKEYHTANEDKEHSNNRLPRALTPAKQIAPLLLSPSFSSLNSTTQLPTPKTPPAIKSGCSHPPVTPFPFPPPPFPPALPPVPPRLPNGTIPIPPPGWIPPSGHHTSIPIPPPPILRPPSIPPPPTFLGPPPPLVPPSVPPLVHTYPLPMQPPGPLDKGNPPRHGLAPLPFPRPPWPTPPFPRFNPFVPPPDYPLVRENPHKVTVEKVLEVIMEELKSIIKKDIMRRMIEGVAFKAFEDWWDSQEKKTKIQVSPLKSGAASVEERNKLINPLMHVSSKGRKPPLPSFKVKKKRADDAATSEETENMSCSTHESSDVKQKDDTVRLERAKRRHARPHELDSDDDEGKEEDNTLQDEETTSDKVETIVPADDDIQILCDRDDHDDGDDSDHPEEEKELAKEHTDDEDADIVQSSDGVQCLDSETFSESSSSEEGEYSSDFNTSDSISSESFEDSSYSDFSPEDEDMEEDGDGSGECIIVSSDEESMELEPPVTPSAPLTPGAQLELGLQDWADPFHREGTAENQYASCRQDACCDLDIMMELQTSEPQDHLRPPSPIGLPAVEPHLDVEMESPEWTEESPGNVENLRPLTPTGCLLDSDRDLLIRSKPTSPAVEEVERPQTPGKGIVAELESVDSADEVLSLSPTGTELVLAPSDPLTSYPSYQDMPKTPGREDRCGWTSYISGRAPATPGRETTMSEGSTMMCQTVSSPPPVPSLSSNPYITAPKTPGRDIILPHRAIVHRRKTQMVTTLHPLLNDSLEGSPISVSSVCSLSEYSSDSDHGKGMISSGGRLRPLQGLENVPGLLDDENRTETETSLLRRLNWRRLKRRRNHHQRRSLKRITHSAHRHPYRWRTPCEEKRILNSVWKKGLDEEDMRLLRCTYERLQARDNGFGWISDTLWIPHPLTKVLTEGSEELRSWLPKHRTGSARSEGFYKISRKDKMKYLNNTKLTAELPSTSTQQGMCIPAQQPTSLRAGSDFRSEQRRLLSSFSCDSDLVKFNQLKFRKKRICFSRSHIHEWGLFAMEPIAADEMVIEYVGQIIRQVIADMREQRYEEEGIGSSYLFRVDQDTIIDATKCGNLARFINHSCNPNCYAKIITVESQKKIVIYSRQPISINEEITYDYKFPIEETKIPCLCGADSCRGSLN
ncbi:histone-lysine N-methyltransferase SETD1B-A-like isoform X3 [Epinephelus fuscoguttatus]|uniref:histone-lysine N-methyltransferase SETD1B-A-like isoform X3 n=1 Tax=Epinephelus fuscoguttatus TaxID=293821 RepID=UPI0020D000E6|nr:histone-lysine N-methyltransferase SETD1B-A-like isoform X3 [Epinephelus fuscoguttatus]